MSNPTNNAAAQALDAFTAATKPSNSLAASAAVNDYTKHPKRWLTSQQRTIGQMRDIRFEEIRRGNITMTEAERNAYLQKLAAAKN